MIPELSAQQSQPSSSTKTDTQNSEQQYEPIWNIYRQIRESLILSSNFKETLNSFNSMNVYNKISLSDQMKLVVFLRPYLSRERYTQKQKLDLIDHIVSLEEQSQPAKELPPVRTSSGREAYETPRYIAYRNSLSEEDPETSEKQEPKRKKRALPQGDPTSSSATCGVDLEIPSVRTPSGKEAHEPPRYIAYRNSLSEEDPKSSEKQEPERKKRALPQGDPISPLTQYSVDQRQGPIPPLSEQEQAFEPLFSEQELEERWWK